MRGNRKVYFVTVYFVMVELDGQNIMPVGSTDYIVAGEEPPNEDTVRALFEHTHVNATIAVVEVRDSHVSLAEFDNVRLRSRR